MFMIYLTIQDELVPSLIPNITHELKISTYNLQGE